MEKVVYQVDDLLKAQAWFDTLLYGAPCPGGTHPPDPIVYEKIPNQEQPTIVLMLTLRDVSEQEIHYWIISIKAYETLSSDPGTIIYEKPQPIPGSENLKGILECSYIRQETEPIIRPRRRVGIIVNPNIGILTQNY